MIVHGGGAKTLEIPVNHRPRRAGVSKYGVWNRLGRGLSDLFAMAWYQKRRLRPIECVELPAPAPPGTSEIHRRRTEQTEQTEQTERAGRRPKLFG